MTLTVEQQRFITRGAEFLRWTQRVFFTTGILAVVYVGLTVLRARFYHEATLNNLKRKVSVEAKQVVSLPGTVAKEGDVLGRIEIPRLGMRVAILEGTTSRILQLGVGHIEGTPLPGEVGNSAIAGHRDSFFRSLKDIRQGDVIQIQAPTGLSYYQVDSLQIVTPDNIAVLAPSAESVLTLVTCYPFRFVGAAPQRFVVHAHRE